MTSGDRKRARAAMLEVIENQIRDGDPPETRQTLERLLCEGHSRAEAMKMIACALAIELVGIMKENAAYDNARYVANLKRLPELPWEEE